MGENITPSKMCLDRIEKLNEFVEGKNNSVKEAIGLAQAAQNEAKVAIERQKAAESTLAQAIQNYNNDDAGGREEDFSFKLKN